MKKIISTILAGFMTLSCITAQAAGRTAAITQTISDNSEIHILYNDTVVKYDDVKPVNTDGRVMIPFRAALENMGATVDYNNDSRMVTAKKGDIEIKFTLMDDTIYVDKNGVQSTITMDVPMIIVSDRTLVPIRFMSNAFDMQVGWDGETETVIILDYEDYGKTINASAPNLAKMSQLEMPVNIKGTTSFDITFNSEGFSEEGINLSLSGKTDSVKLDNSGSDDISVNFSGFGVEIKDAKLSVAMADEKAYVKTDLIEKIAPQIKDEAVQNKLKMVSSDKWYSVDFDKLIDALPMPEESKTAFEAILAGNKSDVASMITTMTKTEGDATLDSAVFLASFIDTIEGMDKFITVTEKDNGGYEAKFNITDNDLKTIMLNMMGLSNNGLVSDEELKKEMDAIKISVSSSSAYDGSKLNGDAAVDMNIDADGVKMGIKMNINESFTKDDKLETVKVPADSVDITDMLIEAIK